MSASFKKINDGLRQVAMDEGASGLRRARGDAVTTYELPLGDVGRAKTKKHNNQLVGHATIYLGNEGTEMQSEMLGREKKRRTGQPMPFFSFR